MINSSAKQYSSRGFTLIEAMVVVVIIAILAAIAYPSYISQIRKSKRAAAKSALLEIANREEQFFFSNSAYTDDLTTFGYSDPTYFSKESIPTSASANAVYQLTAAITSCGTTPCFKIQAVPQNDQVNDTCGTFSLTSSNEKEPDPATSDCW